MELFVSRCWNEHILLTLVLHHCPPVGFPVTYVLLDWDHVVWQLHYPLSGFVDLLQLDFLFGCSPVHPNLTDRGTTYLEASVDQFLYEPFHRRQEILVAAKCHYEDFERTEPDLVSPIERFHTIPAGLPLIPPLLVSLASYSPNSSELRRDGVRVRVKELTTRTFPPIIDIDYHQLFLERIVSVARLTLFHVATRVRSSTFGTSRLPGPPMRQAEVK